MGSQICILFGFAFHSNILGHTCQDIGQPRVFKRGCSPQTTQMFLRHNLPLVIGWDPKPFSIFGLMILMNLSSESWSDSKKTCSEMPETNFLKRKLRRPRARKSMRLLAVSIADRRCFKPKSHLAPFNRFRAMWMWLSIFLPAVSSATAATDTTDTCTLGGACAAQSAALLQSSVGPGPKLLPPGDFRRITPCQDSNAFTPDKDGWGREIWQKTHHVFWHRGR